MRLRQRWARRNLRWVAPDTRFAAHEDELGEPTIVDA